MKRIAFVLPYFGHFNNYFQLYLYTCALNADLCDWLIFTDDYTPYRYPENVKVYYTNWEDMRSLIKGKMAGIGCNAIIERPYKLCDYKPVYGYIFNDYLKDYDFWGECDCDLIWGKISDFVTDELLNCYDKLFDLGHCTIYRNIPTMNMLFMKPINGRERYKEVFEDGENHQFDEEYKDSINDIAVLYGIKMYDGSFAANTYTKSSNFRLTALSSDKIHYYTEPKSESVFIWQEGVLKRYINNNGIIRENRYIYLHFQARTMKVNIPLVDMPYRYKIIPNSFDEIEVDFINDETFRKIKKKHMNLHYFRLRTKNMITKIRRLYGGRK